VVAQFLRIHDMSRMNGEFFCEIFSFLKDDFHIFQNKL